MNPNRSTGPRTAAGIENCKYNATRHGLTGQQLVLKGENAAEYDALRLALIDEHQPASEDEAMLVERICQNYWKMLRAERHERQLFDYFASINEDVFASKRYTNYMRYRNAIERSWNRARAELAALKTASRKAEAKTAPKPINAIKPAKPATPARPLTAAATAATAPHSVSHLDLPVTFHENEIGPS